MSKVYLVPARADEPDEALEAAVDALWVAADLGRTVRPRDLTAIKLHVGEPGTRTFVRPAIVRALVRRLAAAEARPFLTDTAVLYRSPRDTAVGHAAVADEHGFGLREVGAPFVPADGLIGADEVDVRVDGRHFETVAIAAGIVQARSLLVVTHVTGHLVSGLGGTLKNLGMGCASRKGKLRQHHGQQPWIEGDSCTGCGTCFDFCPSEAITVTDTAVIDAEQCIGCGECIAVCRDGAVAFDWGVMGPELQERVVDHATAIVRGKPGRIAYVSALQAVTKDCDCMGMDQPPLLDDVGLLASFDPVALDQAALDLVRARSGQSLESMSYPRLDGTAQLAYAEERGLGERAVELITVER